MTTALDRFTRWSRTDPQRKYTSLYRFVCGMAVAELLALREQMARSEEQPNDAYDPQDRSLANTMRALRRGLRRLTKYGGPSDNLFQQLSQAKVLRYTNHTDKRARYRPANPDKKPLGEPTVRKLNTKEHETLKKHDQRIAA